MESRKPSVLLIGETAQGSSYLSIRMETRGCECSFASSCREAFLILRGRKFDLVLCPTTLRDGSLHSIMSLLEGSGTTVFFSCMVEDGCWWLPALRCGQKCFGSPALRPSEFVTLLDETNKQLRRVVPAALASQPLRVLRADGSVISPP